MDLEMLLCPVKGRGRGERGEDLPSDVALEAAKDLLIGEAFGGAPSAPCAREHICRRQDRGLIADRLGADRLQGTAYGSSEGGQRETRFELATSTLGRLHSE